MWWSLLQNLAEIVEMVIRDCVFFLNADDSLLIHDTVGGAMWLFIYL